MTNKNDQYQIYIDEDKTAYYYKNKQLHRENGPAIIKINDNESRIENDGGLYSITFNPVSKKAHTISNPDTIQIPMVGDKIKKLLENLRNDTSSIISITNSNTAFSDSPYFLDGLNYSKNEFEKIVSKENNSSRKARL